METNLISSKYVLPLADSKATLETVGGKGASLARLVGAGLPVPDGFHVTTAAYQRFVADNDLQQSILAALEQVDISQPPTLETASQTIGELFAGAQTPPEVASAIALAYASLSGRDPIVAGEPQDGSLKQLAAPVAVRSSATAEDLPEASFAGQQDTYLNVHGYSDVLAAVKHCWASLWTARAIGYRARQNIEPDGLSLAVVVQLLVPADAAGILFTANPINGRRDQAIISAAWGLGEAVVGGLVIPDNITVDKISGQIVQRETADKQVLTARVQKDSAQEKGLFHVNGGTEEQPVPEALRRAPVLDDERAIELAQLGIQIEELYAMPMDIEWVLADGAFAIVQARPITALPPEPAQPELAVELPDEWPMPDPKGPYMRGSIADFMPDPLTPLFATIVIPAYSAAMQRTLQESIGGTVSFLGQYLTTINDYAYLYANLGCRDWAWVVLRMAPAIPRLLRNGERHWREVARPRYREAVARWRDRSPQELTAAELLIGADNLTAAMADYLTALQVHAIGTASGTEGLFITIYDKFIKREGDPPAAALLLGSDSTPIKAEKALYDLAQWCRERGDPSSCASGQSLAAYLLETPSTQLAEQLCEENAPLDSNDWREWQHRFRDHLDQYGHSIYDLDFAKPLPVDEPLPLLETLKLFIRGEGTNPHERQRKSVERREEAIETTLVQTKGLKRRLFRWSLRWAQTYALVREDSIFDIGLGYPVLRNMLHELGKRFVQAQAMDDIAQPDDIFWLERAEVERGAVALDRGETLEDFSGRIQERKAVWQAEKRLTPPPQLPPKSRIMGVKTDAFMAMSAEDQTGDAIKGVAASPGQVTAPARVLLGPEDFSQMQPGDILVAEITTPAWTPLFAMAAGVVTDVGGPLSHGSIVAREYGIPAVLGTGVATQRIRSGQIITVDGSAGEITFVQE